MTDLSAKARLGRLDALSRLAADRRKATTGLRAVPQPRHTRAIVVTPPQRVPALSCR